MGQGVGVGVALASMEVGGWVEWVWQVAGCGEWYGCVEMRVGMDARPGPVTTGPGPGPCVSCAQSRATRLLVAPLLPPAPAPQPPLLLLPSLRCCFRSSAFSLRRTVNFPSLLFNFPSSVP